MKKQQKRIKLGDIDFDDYKIYLETIIGLKIDEKIEEKELVKKDDLKHLPTKDEFYDRMDKLSKEISDSREEKTALENQTSDHEERIVALEELHPNHQHFTKQPQV